MPIVLSGQVSRLFRLTCLLFAASLLPTWSGAQQQSDETWPLLACADPDNLPYSNDRGEGFEIEIAQVIADEVGAELQLAWLPQPLLEGTQELMLRMGFCDVLLAVPDGKDPYLTTIPYYNSTSVFVFPQDAPFEIESLDDPDLAELRIGVHRGSPADFALTERGLIGNVDHFQPNEPREAILSAVADGELDVGIVWGPIAGYYTQRLQLPVVLEPVTPQISSGVLSMVQATSMAVRAHDRALQDRLNRAIASRWEEIQAVLQRWNVPTVAQPQPQLGETETSADRLLIGLVLPSLSAIDPLLPLGPELAAEPARQGAILAEERLGGGAFGPFQLLVASAPSAESADRAARRLILADGASALIGGLGEGQAVALSSVSDDLGALFVDIGTSERPARCTPNSFHIEASDDMYLRAIAELLQAEGLQSPYLVYTDDERGRFLYQRWLAISSGTEEAGSEAVQIDQPLFIQTFSRIEESGADAVVLLLPAGPQLVFLGQYETSEVGARAFAFPSEVTQTRQFYAALAQDAPKSGTGPRVALWDAALTGEPAELNESYFARWGRPMDPTAWAGYSAVKLVFDTFEATQSTQPQVLARRLRSPDFPLEIGKGGELGFDPATGQLLQPLYVVTIEAGAPTLEELAIPVSTIPPLEETSSEECSAR